MLMLWHHLFLRAEEYGGLTMNLAIVSKVCVALFLFVSGYGLTKQYRKVEKPYFKGTLKFLLRRFVNFYLPYWFCFVLVIAIGHLGGFTFHDAYPATRNTLKCVLLDVFGQMGYDSYLKPWWFNKLIIQLYFFFPFLYLLLRNQWVAILVLVLIPIMQVNASRVPGNLFFIVEGGLPAFYLGMVSANYQLAFPADKKTKTFRQLTAILSCIGLSWILTTLDDPYITVLIRALLAFSIVVFICSFESQQKPVLVFLGKYATIMYLTHVLFIHLMPNVVYAARYSFLVFLVFLSVCLLSAILISFLQKRVQYDSLRLMIVKRIEKW